MFKLGDTVNYPGHGIGKVISEEVKEIFGFKETFLRIQCGGMTIVLPRRQCRGVGMKKVSPKKC